jgi:hypothetical protein
MLQSVGNGANHTIAQVPGARFAGNAPRQAGGLVPIARRDVLFVDATEAFQEGVRQAKLAPVDRAADHFEKDGRDDGVALAIRRQLRRPPHDLRFPDVGKGGARDGTFATN